MTRHKLEIEYEYDFLLFGVCCYEKDYRFVWSVNNALPGDFVKEEDIRIKDKSASDPLSFAVFRHTDEVMHTDYFIISNKSEGGQSLIPEHKKADYLLMVKGELSEELREEIPKRIKSITQVLMVYEINADGLKSKQHLIF
ncbi:MAG: IPExxxVDY family protein [Bacteroidia bacterium]|nr:IPExxxVDY family protein [Bacteroidia bacterium]